MQDVMLKAIIVATISIWMGLVGLYGYMTVQSKLALPPTGDTYAHTVGFQVISFLVFKLPGLLSVLAVVLLIQLFVARLQRSSLSSFEKRVLSRTLWVGVAITVVAAVWFLGTDAAPYNPYFQRDEQLALHFMTFRLPFFALALGLILAAEHRWLSRDAS